jgi:hypothetical protein
VVLFQSGTQRQQCARGKEASKRRERLRKQGMCDTMALPFTLKKYFKAKEELWKLKYFTIHK